MGNGPRTCKRNVGVSSRGGAWRKELCTALPTVRAGTTRRMKKSSAFTGWSTSGAGTHKVDSLLARRSTSVEVLGHRHAWISRAPALCSWEWGGCTAGLCGDKQPVQSAAGPPNGLQLVEGSTSAQDAATHVAMVASSPGGPPAAAAAQHAPSGVAASARSADGSAPNSPCISDVPGDGELDEEPGAWELLEQDVAEIAAHDHGQHAEQEHLEVWHDAEEEEVAEVDVANAQQQQQQQLEEEQFQELEEEARHEAEGKCCWASI